MCRLYCGCSGWNYPHWREVFYPSGVPQREWLEHYARSFDTVEINSSFYRLPPKTVFEQWRRRTPDGFVFAVKASRYLTHIKKLAEPAEPLQRLLDASAGLAEKRGPVLYQFPPGWSIDIERLEAFLSVLPADIRHVFEFRNDTWHCDKLWSLLADHNAAYCMMDSPGLPLHVKRTADFCYVRMHSGEERGRYSERSLNTWAKRIEELLHAGDVYVYFNNDLRGYAVENALTLRRMITGDSGR